MNAMEIITTTNNQPAAAFTGKLKTEVTGIFKAMGTAGNALLEIAYRLKAIKDGNLTEGTDYKDVYALAAGVFGYKDQTTRKYIQAAQLIVKDGNRYHTTFATIDSETGKVVSDYTIGKLIEFAGLSKSDGAKVIEMKEVTPDSTAREIRDAVKEYTAEHKSSKGRKASKPRAYDITGKGGKLYEDIMAWSMAAYGGIDNDDARECMTILNEAAAIIKERCGIE